MMEILMCGITVKDFLFLSRNLMTTPLRNFTLQGDWWQLIQFELDQDEYYNWTKRDGSSFFIRGLGIKTCA
jgi:hypothetical protein